MLAYYSYYNVNGYACITVADAVFSTYKNSIIILLWCMDEADEDDYYSYIDEYYPDYNTFRHDTNTVYQYLDNTGNTITDYDYEGNEVLNTSNSLPCNIYAAGNMIFILCSGPFYIFAYDIRDTSSTIYPKFRYDFEYNFGDWVDYYEEFVRDEVYTQLVNISISETKDYIALCVTERQYSIDWVTMGDYGYDNGTFSYYTHILLVNKTTGGYSEIEPNYFNSPPTNTSGADEEFLYTSAVSCCDYDNNKFLICSGASNNSKAKIIEIDASSGIYTGIEVGYNECYRVIELAGTICTLYLKASKIYIKKGYDFSTITDLSTYILLSNVACDTYNSTCSISEDINQLNYSHKSLIFIVDAYNINGNTNYGFIGEMCLPLINEEGYNAFIKIKD